MGCVYKQQYTRGGKTRKCAVWWAKYRDEHGKERRVSTRCRNRQAALTVLTRLVQDAELRRAGIRSDLGDYAALPLDDQLNRWRDYLRDKGGGAGHPETMERRARAVVEGCGFTRLADVSAEKVLALVARLTCSEQTRAYYLRETRSFTRWLTRGRPLVDPLAGVHLPAVTEFRRLRRALSPAEMGKLLDATGASGRAIYGLDGAARRLLYLLAMTTGFRAGELAELTPESFDLTAPYVRLPARHAKNRRTATQPLPPYVVAELVPWLAVRRMGEPLWPGCWHKKAAAMLRTDLEAAGIPFVVQGPDGPCRADFHALRHSYVSALVAGGTDPKTAQDLARLSSAQLLLSRYSHSTAKRRADAVALLTPLLTPAGASDCESRPAPARKSRMKAAGCFRRKAKAG